jgi:REP element-mobilizing transposase RayT
VRDLIREICRTHEIETSKGTSGRSHVHLLLSVAPHPAPSRVMQLRSEFWGRHL